MEVTVEKMTLGGSGLARYQSPEGNLVLFIPYAAPGDVLRVRITEQKKTFAFAEIEEILKPSPFRQAPPCPVFGRCGGCNWQHLKYDEQLRQKQLIVEEQLQRVLDSKTEILPIAPSPQDFNYRNRIQVHVQNGQWGYFARRSHQLVPTHVCLISEPSLVAELEKLAPKAAPGRYQVALHQDLSVGVENTDQKSEDPEDLGFSQVNRFQNEKLIAEVLAWSEASTSWPEIWDLYAGAGNFTFPLSQKHRKAKITAVELSKKSVQAAQAILREQSASPNKFQFYLSDVSHFLKRARLETGGFVLLDPPRNGCDPEVIRRLMQQKFTKILYVSCNPSTLARDLKLMKEQGPPGLRISRVKAFDMFPQTDHVEVLTELVVDELPL